MRIAATVVFLLGLVTVSIPNGFAEDTQSMKELSPLVQLAENEFGSLDSNHPFRKLISKVEKSQMAVFSNRTGEQLSATSTDSNWSTSDTLSAKHLEWLLTDPAAIKLVTRHGVQVQGAQIQGTLNLAFSNVPFPVVILSCSIPEGVDLTSADLRIVALSGSHVGPIPGTNLSLKVVGTTIRDSLQLNRGFAAKGEVCLGASRIGGDLMCDGSVFCNPAGFALNADRANIAGAAFLNGVNADGEVRFVGAYIGNRLEAIRSTFRFSGEHPPSDNNAKLDQNKSPEVDTIADGKANLNLDGVSLGSDLVCTGTALSNRNKEALKAVQATIKGSVFLDSGFAANGSVDFATAEIGGSLRCTGASLTNANGKALSAPGARIQGLVLLNAGFTADGEVQLVRTVMGNFLNCAGATLKNSEGRALDAEGATIGSSLLFDGIVADGEVRLLGTKVGGNLYCDGASFKTEKENAIVADNLEVAGSVFFKENFLSEGSIRLHGAAIGGNLECSSATMSSKNGKALNAERADIKGAFTIKNRSLVDGAIILSNVEVGSNIECMDSTLRNPGGFALVVEGSTVSGSVFFRKGFRAEGEVRFFGATIDGNFECLGSALENSAGFSLLAESATVAGNLVLSKGFTAKGQVRLRNARIGGKVDCSGAHIDAPNGCAIDGDRLYAGDTVFLNNGFTCNGEIRLNHAEIGANLEFGSAALNNSGSRALSANGVVVKGWVFLNKGFQAKGEVALNGTKIDGSLACPGAMLSNPGGTALAADSATIGGALFLIDGFHAEGEVRFLAANIAVNVECGGAILDNPSGHALNVGGANIGREVLLIGGFSSKGQVDLNAATVGGDVKISQADLSNPHGRALSAEMTTIDGSMVVGKDASFQGHVSLLASVVRKHFIFSVGRSGDRNDFSLDLQHMSIGTLSDDMESWAVCSKYDLGEFSYDRIASSSPRDVASRLHWLKGGQLNGSFQPGPYTQLAEVLEKTGQASEAREVRIEREREQSRQPSSWYRKVWDSFLYRAIAYGYKPWNSVGWSLLVCAIGLLIFSFGHQKGRMVPSDPQAFEDSLKSGSPRYYPRYNSLVYSIDLFLPIIDLQQSTYWIPASGNLPPWQWKWLLEWKWPGVRNWASIWWTEWQGLWLWQRFQITAGWVLTTLLVASFTGLLKT
ncbi:MAG: hypothetical protein JNK74_21265 [Candidatus Hydrogenedentes bacterium]|nr:hypothetical protein [Candidatus Hydrogenedentota bacterium]